MKAKFTRGSDRNLGIRFEPENFDEQLLLEGFARDSETGSHEFRFSSWEHNHSGRACREGLTSAWGEIVATRPAEIAASGSVDGSADGGAAEPESADQRHLREALAE
jgi:hypothetical protein